MAEANITELRERLATYLKAVARGETILLTHHGRPIAKLVPVDDRRADATRRIEALRATAIVGDIESPIEANWGALEP